MSGLDESEVRSEVCPELIMVVVVVVMVAGLFDDRLLYLIVT